MEAAVELAMEVAMKVVIEMAMEVAIDVAFQTLWLPSRPCGCPPDLLAGPADPLAVLLDHLADVDTQS